MTRLSHFSAARGIPRLPLCSMAAVSWGPALTGTRASGGWDWPIIWVISAAPLSHLTTTECFRGVC
jgi:hypothetical protein